MARVVDPRSDRPVYKQIADRLRSAIGDGVYAPGDLLPSEHELAAKYGVDMPIVNEMYAVLVHGASAAAAYHGLLLRKPGREIDYA